MLNLFSYDFMQRAFLAVIAMSLFSPILGTFLILRRQSLMMTRSVTFHWQCSFWFGSWTIAHSHNGACRHCRSIFLEYLRTIYKNFMESGQPFSCQPA